MEAAFNELPLALFTTLAPIGAGAFVTLALAFLTSSFSDEQTKRIDRMTLVPLAVVIVGFAASFFHLASPLHAFNVFSGTGHSPLSNEILVGSIFVVLAVAYTVAALAGKLTGRARTAFSAVVAVAALVFACFTGMAYLMETIASWNTPLVPVQLVGFALVGGAALGELVLALAGALGDALRGGFKTAVVGMALVGALMAVVGLGGQALGVSSLANPLVSGADLVATVMPWLVCALVCLVIAAAGAVAAAIGKSPLAAASLAVVLAVAGVFVARLVFYAMQMSVAL